MVIKQAVNAFATKLANCAQEGKPYQFVETVAGKAVILRGLGYELSVFQVNGTNMLTRDTIDTRNKFKRFIISTLNSD